MDKPPTIVAVASRLPGKAVMFKQMIERSDAATQSAVKLFMFVENREETSPHKKC